MSSLRRVSLNVALILTPMVGTGCVQMSPQTVYRQTMSASDARMDAAKMQEGRGNLAQAKERYLELFKENPRNVESAHRLGVICTQLNQPTEAEIYFRQAYAVTPNDPELLADMGYSAFIRKDFEQADSFLEQSVRINGNDPQAVQNLAIARAWRGKDESSLATFRLVYPEDEAIRRLKAIQVARGGNVRVQSNIDTIAKANPRKPATLAGVAQSKMPAIDSTPIYLPSPSPSPLPALAKTRSIPVEVPNPAANLALAASIESQIELPSPLPALAVESFPTVQLSLNKEVVQVSDSKTPISKPVQVLAEPSKQESESLRSIERISEVIVETAISSSPALPIEPTVIEPTEMELALTESAAMELTVTEPAEMEAAATEPSETEEQPVPRSTPLTVWRKTSDSYSGWSDARYAKPRDLDGDQESEDAKFNEVIKDGWGVCLVTLLEENRLEFGLPQYVVEYESRHFRFSSVEAMKKFQMAPQRYTPVAAGRDIVAIKNGDSEVQGSLNFALRYRKQLYLFGNAENARAFRSEPEKYVAVE